jgi:DNA-binding NarL/FixJ family response regulator
MNEPGERLHPAIAVLTSRELAVLRMLAHGNTTGDIAAALGISQATTKSHISHVLLKLGLKDRVQAVVFAYRCGLVDPASLPPLAGRRDGNGPRYC